MIETEHRFASVSAASSVLLVVASARAQAPAVPLGGVAPSTVSAPTVTIGDVSALAPPSSDAVLAALRGQHVSLALRDGASVHGVLLDVTPDSVVIARTPAGQVAIVPLHDLMIIPTRSGDVQGVRVVFAPSGNDTATRVPPAEPESPPELVLAPAERRHFGFSLAGPPARAFDVQYAPFYAFTSVSVLMPFLQNEDYYGGSHYWAATFGAGATFRLVPTSRWQFDLFGIITSSNWDSSDSSDTGAFGAFGLGIGAHITLSNGFTFGVKVPT